MDTFSSSVSFGLAQSHVQKHTQKDAPTADRFISYRMRRLSHLAFDKLDYHKLFCLFDWLLFTSQSCPLCFEWSSDAPAFPTRCARVSEPTRTLFFINQIEPVTTIRAPIESASVHRGLASLQIVECPFRDVPEPPRSEVVQS